MKFTRRDDILVAWGNDGIQYYVPLVQSLDVNVSTNVSTISQSGTYEKRQEVLTAPTVETSIEILGKDNIINEELYFFNSPNEIERQIFNDINSPINIFILLNDTNDYDDLIRAVEMASMGEKHDVYGLKIDNCYINSYSLSIEAGGLINHNLGFSGSNIEGKRIEIKEDAENNLSLVPKNIGLAYKLNLYSSDGLFNQPVSSFSIDLNIDRKIKYTFSRKIDIPNSTNNFLAPKINKAESSSNCTLTINTVSDLKSKDFTTEYLRNAKSLLKDFRIIHDEPSKNNAPIRTSINFYNTTLNSVSIEENVDGLMNISYSFNVVVPTETISDIRKGITTRKRYEKYIPAKNRSEILNINESYRTDLQNGVWDWELDNLENGTSLFDYLTYPSENILEKFVSSCPKLVNANRMFRGANNLKKISLYLPNCTTANEMFYPCTSIEEAIVDLPKCTNINSLFRNCASLKKLIIKRHNSTSASTLAYICAKLQKIDMDFSNITSLSYMGERCGFTEFKHNTTKVSNINNFLFHSEKMKEFNSPFPLVKYASNAFGYAFIRTFRYPIDEDGNCIYVSGRPQAKNTDGSGIYEYLTLPNLIDGTNAFINCRVDLPSAVSILKSLQQKDTSLGTSAKWILTLGMENTYKENQSVLEAIQQATGRGWQVNMTWRTPYNPFKNSSRAKRAILKEEKPSWFKKQEYDGGEYEDEYGRRWQILRADEIFCDSKNASQLGYKKFSSDEEAIDEWKLVYKGSEPPSGEECQESSYQ